MSASTRAVEGVYTYPRGDGGWGNKRERGNSKVSIFLYSLNGDSKK